MTRFRFFAAPANLRLRDTMDLLVFSTTACVSVMLLLFWAVRAIQPTFGPVKYQFDGQPVQTGTLPLVAETKAPHLWVEVPVIVPVIHASALTMTIDDCLENLTVHGVIVDDPIVHVCASGQGQRIGLRKYLRPGMNTVRFDIRDNGTLGGVRLRPSLLDPVTVLLGALALGLFCLYLAFVMRLFRAPHWSYFLVGILLIGFLLRLGMASHPGHGGDININQNWARSAVTFGVAQSYKQQLDGNMLPNYPPLSMLVFAATGHAYKFLFSPNVERLPIFLYVIKFPAIIADLVTTALLFFLFRTKRGPIAASVAAAVYVLHPVVLHNSVVWGQTDSLYALFMVACLMACARKHWALCGVLAASALLIKLQAAPLVPVVCAALALRSRGIPAFLSGVVVTLTVVYAPFALGGAFLDALRVYSSLVGFYPSLTMNAYNFWWSVFEHRRSDPDTAMLLLGLTYRQVGLLIVGAFSMLSLFAAREPLLAWRKKTIDVETLMLTTALIAYAFFLFSTEMHERYLFAYMALGLPLIFRGYLGPILYALTSVCTLLNVLGALSYNSWDLKLFAAFPRLSIAVGYAQIAAFCLTLLLLGVQSWRAAGRSTILRSLKVFPVR